MDEKEGPSRRRIRATGAGRSRPVWSWDSKVSSLNTCFKVQTSRSVLQKITTLCVVAGGMKRSGLLPALKHVKRVKIGSITGSGRELVHWRCIVETDRAVIQH